MSFAAVVERLRLTANPYPGLRPFDVDESHLFFGRDEQVAELVQRLAKHRFLAVLGASGSGKSSLVRAGLIPALERGGVWEAGRRWRRVVTQPAGAPFDSLAVDLRNAGLDGSTLRESSHALIEVARQLPSDESLLVVVDQFEELFRYKDVYSSTESGQRLRQRQAAEAAEFVQLLLAASRHHPPIYIVLTMRTDYLGDCAEFRDLPEMLNECQYLVPRMTRQERKEAIEGPLGRTPIAPNLVQRLLNDAGDEPDHLPVLQHALMRIWSHWRQSVPDGRRRIELQDYEAIGGFSGALNRHADELLASVPADLAERIFKRLTARGRHNRERRDPATLRELYAVCDATTPERRRQVCDVIDRFRKGDATFLRPREGTIELETYVDITHESLIRLWAKLRDEWLPREQFAARTLLEVAERAHNWKAGTGELLSGLDYTRISGWASQRNPSPAWAHHYVDEAAFSEVTEFLERSQAAERARTIRKRVLWAAAVVVILAGVTWYVTQALERHRIEEIEQARSAMALAEASKNAALARQAAVLKAANEQDVRSLQTELVAQTMPTYAPGPDPPSALKPRVYVQVRSRETRDRIEALAEKLREAGVLVPPTQVLDTGPSVNELRYFRQTERAQAEEILTTIRGEIAPTRLAYVEGFENSRRIRDNHFELWIAPASIDPALIQQLNDDSEEVRKAAGGRLARDYRADPQAIRLVLDTLSEQNLARLTSEGLINALYFLTRSDLTAWTDEHKKLARDAIGRIRARNVGPQTAKELNALEDRLSVY